ncbi:MAG TPA: hypothetical protein VMT68_09655 [Caulobacteraceae bacterium]|nr:hypothetical protein [Caulobacteraceae bacterium]
MRVRSLVLVAVLAAAASTAQAQTDEDAARDHFQAELAQQCPQKQLSLLSARDLRDGLDDYMASLGTDDRDRLQQAERNRCSGAETGGAACVNGADLAAADQIGRMQELATWVCGSFLRCRDQGVCDYAR